jgi:peptidylprolyl isomerase
MTTAKQGDKVKIHYTATFENGEVLDSSRDREPLIFVLGGGEVIKGLEKGIAGMEVGESKRIHVAAADAFGERNEEKFISVDRNRVPEEIELKTGVQLKLSQSDGSSIPAKISEITDEKVRLDTNHPYAGKNINFEVELLEVA